MSHTCHAVGCAKAVPPKMLMCLKHWRMVPAENQRSIWATYRPGQEDDKRPSLLYRANQRLAVAEVAEKEGKTADALACRAQAALLVEKLMAITMCVCGHSAADHFDRSMCGACVGCPKFQRAPEATP